MSDNTANTQYMVYHEFSREWLGRLPNGDWGWTDYMKSEKFQTLAEAKLAFGTLSIEKKMYGAIMKPHYIKGIRMK